MSAKRAKAIRRELKELEIIFETERHVPLRNGQLIVLPTSERGVYRSMKKHHGHQQGTGKK